MSLLPPGVRVVELNGDPAAAFAGRLLAAAGADVVKVELPGGAPSRAFHRLDAADPDSSLLAAYLDAGKRSILLDPAAADDRDRLRALVGAADLVIESGEPGAWRDLGLDIAALRRARPSLSACSITPFGPEGPRARWRVTALTALAAGGQLALCGEPDLPPLKTAGHQAHYQAGLHAYSPSLTALLAAARSGTGEHVRLSIQEVQAAGLEGFGPAAMTRGSDAERTGNQARAIWGIYPCADGYIGIASMARQTPSVYACIGQPDLADDPAFTNLLLYPDNNDLVAALLSEWALARTAREIWDESDRYRAPFALIPTPADLLGWPPLAASGFWYEVEHPRVGRHLLPATAFSVDGVRGRPGRAPLLGEHTAEILASLEALPPAPPAPAPAGLPLEGVTVLDLTQVWAGPYATRLLADMGADVIHIEGPGFPDAVRVSGRPDEPRPFDRSSYFNEYNRNKRGLVLDLQHPEGVAVFRRMVERADVVIENWSVGVAEGLGIGFADLRAINPRIIMCQMPGFAQDGVEARRVGFGPSIEQMGGIVALQGYEGGPPHKSGISYGDPVGGVAAAGAVALALLRRERTGEGAKLVIFQRDNVIGLVGEYMLAESAGQPLAARLGNRDPHFAPHNVYRTSDDTGRIQVDLQGRVVREYEETWLALAVDSDAAWEALRTVIADPRLDDPAYARVAGRRAAEAAIDAVIAEWARDRDPAQAADFLQRAGVSAVPVLTPLMLVRDEHLQAAGYFPTIVHREVGPHLTTHPAWRLSERRQPVPGPAPCFGQHNDQVLRELAGCTAEEIARLAAAGVIATQPRG